MKLVVPLLSVFAFAFLPSPVAAQQKPFIIDQPEDLTLLEGEYISFFVNADGDEPLSYQWKKNGIALSGGTDDFYLKDEAAKSDAGAYTVKVSNPAGSVTSVVAMLTVLIPPAITKQPASKTLIAGSNFTFTVKATGSEPLGYQWFHDDTPIDGATSTNLVLLNVQPEDEGIYTISVSNPAVDYGADEAVSDPATLTVWVPPYIIDQPEDQEAVEGDFALFSVLADGTDTETCPLTYQWRFKGVALLEETDEVLELFDVMPADAGAYSVLIANNAATLISSNAMLTVLSPPVITTQPQNRKAPVGTYAVFSVTVAGSEPIYFQWRYNGEDIPDATNSTLIFMATNTDQRGLYSVYVWNDVDEDESDEASLSVVAETVLPTVAITSPADGSLWSNAVITVVGTASDNVAVDYVAWGLIEYQLIYRAVGTNDWVATFNGTPGINWFRCRAFDTSGNDSFPRGSRIFYVVPTPLTLGIIGGGTVTPNYNGTMLIIQSNYVMTATAASGWEFTKWTGGLTSTDPTLAFTMQAGLTLTANFVDVQNPTITVVNPLPGGAVSNSLATVSGVAADNWGVASVWYQFNNNAWILASGTTNWSATVNLAPGTNTFSVYSMDLAGKVSPTNTTVSVVVLASARPTVTGITRNSGTANVSFTTVSGLIYSLEYKNMLTDAVWNVLVPSASGTGGIVTLPDTNAPASNRYYRVRAM